MATFNAYTYRAKMPELGFVFDLAGATYKPDGGNIFVVSYANYGSLAVFGNGFQYSGTKPNAGTITGFQVRDDGNNAVYDFGNLNLSVQEFYGLANGNLQQAVATIFSGRDTITGSSDGDILNGYGGADIMDGRFGNDVYFVNHAGDRVIEQGNKGTNDIVKASVSYKLQDVPTEGIETLQLVGTKAINATGSVFNNKLFGNAGANVLSGLEGNDTLKGGGGADTFQFKEAVSLDKIVDFNRIDRIVLDDQLYQDFGYLGRLRANEFKDIGEPGARVDQDDKILYNSDTGALFYDFNGSTPSGRTQIITLLNKADLNFDDIFIA